GLDARRERPRDRRLQGPREGQLLRGRVARRSQAPLQRRPRREADARDRPPRRRVARPGGGHRARPPSFGPGRDAGREQTNTEFPGRAPRPEKVNPTPMDPAKRQKLRTIAYWVTTILGPASFVIGGVLFLRRAEQPSTALAELGYPPYLLKILGTWKILGA